MWFRGAAEPEEAITKSETCDVLASNILLSGAELEFNRPGREYLVKTALAHLEERYDYIIVDTPPALNLLTVNAYVAADSLIIPMAPEVLSLLGVAQIKETIESVRGYYNPACRCWAFCSTGTVPGSISTGRYWRWPGRIAAQLETRVFDAKIRGSVAAAEAPAHGVSVVDYAPRSNPARDFEALCDEIAGSRFPGTGRTGRRGVMATRKSSRTSKTDHVLSLLAGTGGDREPEAPAPHPTEEETAPTPARKRKPSAKKAVSRTSAQTAPESAPEPVPPVQAVPASRHMAPPILEVARLHNEALSETIRQALTDSLEEELARQAEQEPPAGSGGSRGAAAGRICQCSGRVGEGTPGGCPGIGRNAGPGGGEPD